MAAAPPAPASKVPAARPSPSLSARPQATAAPATVTRPAPPPGSRARRTWAFRAGGAGVALLAGGAVMGVLASSAYQSEKDAAARGDFAAYRSYRDSAKSRALAADALYAAGAVGLGVGTYLWFTGGRTAVAVTPVEGGAMASLSGRF